MAVIRKTKLRQIIVSSDQVKNYSVAISLGVISVIDLSASVRIKIYLKERKNIEGHIKLFAGETLC